VNLAASGTYTSAAAVNNTGQVVARASSQGNLPPRVSMERHGNTRMRDLGNLRRRRYPAAWPRSTQCRRQRDQ